MKKNQNTIKAKPMRFAFGTLTSSLSDKVTTGEEINSGSFPMGSHAGKAKVTHEGRSYEIDLIHDFGASIVAGFNGRNFRLDLEKFIDHAIESGLLNPDLRFEKEDATA